MFHIIIPKGNGEATQSNWDTFIYEGKNKQNNLIFPTFFKNSLKKNDTHRYVRGFSYLCTYNNRNQTYHGKFQRL